MCYITILKLRVRHRILGLEPKTLGMKRATP